MFTDYSAALAAFERHTGPGELTALQRGLEREALRITPEGELSQKAHPQALGSALMHPMITTDYAESLLELITPVHTSVAGLMATLGDVHRFVLRNLDENERLWPLSMPCYVDDPALITLAQYGTSNIGKMKTVYREGLKRRYGSLMQIISGVHYNFSLPDSFWPKWQQAHGDSGSLKDFTSRHYLGLVRNFRRHVWVIPYLFGASPALCRSFLLEQGSRLNFQELESGTLTLPYATALRMSDLGYTNQSQSKLDISYNSLEAYVDSVRRACQTPSEEFAALGVKQGNEWQQLNSNVLQIENELYAPIRPKRVTESGQHPSDALAEGGVQYVEVRSLDVNPLSPLGISEQQIRFLDLFLLWCLLQPSPELDAEQQAEASANLDRVVLNGRDPGLHLHIEDKLFSIAELGDKLLSELQPLADILDSHRAQPVYSNTLLELGPWFANPELTLSGQIMSTLGSRNISQGDFARELAEGYLKQLSQDGYTRVQDDELKREAVRSLQRQQQLEAGDNKTFDQYLADYFS